jgi:hypothetical protein
MGHRTHCAQRLDLAFVWCDHIMVGYLRIPTGGGGALARRDGVCLYTGGAWQLHLRTRSALTWWTKMLTGLSHHSMAAV